MRLGTRGRHLFFASVLFILFGCATSGDLLDETIASDDLRLTKAVLYQNGVGYFERRGKIMGDRLTIRIRADQVNDFLKSLTVIDAARGKAVSVSLPLDRNAARQVMELANRLKEGIGLPELIDILKGTEVTFLSNTGSVSGRVLTLDPIKEEKSEDWRVSVMGRDAVHTVMLSEVKTIEVSDKFIVLGLHKGLDAAATGGVFKVVDVTIHLDNPDEHNLLVSYVVESPAWKPSYRLVAGDKKEVLLQGWAVVDNVTGVPWHQIELSLTSGAPLAFRYDLYAPRFVGRPDLTYVAGQKVAVTAVGETSYSDDAVEAEEETISPLEVQSAPAMKSESADKELSAPPRAKKMQLSRARSSSAGMALDEAPASPQPMPEVSMESLQESARSMVRATAASGAVRYDMVDRVSVPDRSSTLVSILNHRVPGEEAFLYKPGGAGSGYEQNPYRVIRFKNTTGFILEPGPISIYSGGAFVGEGIGESISDGAQATIPFAVDPTILVTSSRNNTREEARLVKIVGGVMTVESFDRIKTTYKVKGGDKKGYRLFVRHQKAGGSYELKDKPTDAEDLGDAWLLPIDVSEGGKETEFVAVEQTPLRRSLTIWDHDAYLAIELLLRDTDDLPAEARAKLTKILEKRQRISKIDTEISHLQKKRQELDERMYQTRENLKALKKNQAADALKARLAAKLEEYSKETDAIAKQIVERTNERMELKVAVDDLLSDLSLDVKRP